MPGTDNEQEQNISNLDNINVEGIKNAGKHLDRGGSSRFNFKKIILVAVVAGGLLIGAIKGIPYATGKLMIPEVPYTITDTLMTNKEATFLDEVLEQNSDNAEVPVLERVTELEKYLDMSNKLKNLNLSLYTDVVIEVEEGDTFSKDLEEKYQEFLELLETTDKDVLSTNSLRLHALAAELNGYRQVVDSKITADGYDIMAEYGILVAKTAVIDASGISYMSIDNLVIPEESDNYTIQYTDEISGKVFTIKIPSTSIIHKVIGNVYSAQTKDIENLTTDEIIADLTEYLNIVKVASFMRFNNNGSLVTTNNYNDVRDIIESPKAK